MQPDPTFIGFYWTREEFSPGFGWAFDAATGEIGVDRATRPMSGVAVRRGDVVAAVPEPQTLLLVLLALGAGVVARRTRPR